MKKRSGRRLVPLAQRVSLRRGEGLLRLKCGALYRNGSPPSLGMGCSDYSAPRATDYVRRVRGVARFGAREGIGAGTRRRILWNSRILLLISPTFGQRARAVA